MRAYLTKVPTAGASDQVATTANAGDIQ